MRNAYSYRVHDVLTGRPLYGDGLPLTGTQWSESLTDPGSLTAAIAITPTNRDTIRVATTPDRACLYVLDTQSRVVWHGIIIARPWSPSERTITITAAHAKAWLTTRLIRRMSGNRHITWAWRDTDQLRIVRDLVTYAASEAGCPPIAVGSQVSGVLRELTVEAQAFRPVAEAIDSMAQRNNGFDWDISARYDGARPVWVLELWYPERRHALSPLLFEATPSGGNILAYDWPDDAAERFTRVWAMGDEPSPPDALMAVDSDPALAIGQALLREKAQTYSGVTRTVTLAEHARAERLASAESPVACQIDVTATAPPLSSYGIGDRARLVLRDEWLDEDRTARITERTVHDTTRDEVAKATLTFDIADHRPPDTEG
ncbi:MULTISPECIES: hypothetical protein [unclassified Nocardiopsis]|uniref:hypothetical protein n=1 Tax=unclassified Nocardiopsis TaxID=2649073 RepID=UPI0013588214|nr:MULTISPECIES: hypothetical protein [unclassified Nocardiopsis]